MRRSLCRKKSRIHPPVPDVERRDIGMEHFVYWTNMEGIGEIAVIDNLDIEDCMKIQEPLRCLAAYERTGMAPEEINRVNNFAGSQAGILLKKLNDLQKKVTLCKECEYLTREKTTGIYWCRLTSGLDVLDLRPDDGCSRGKRKEVTEDETGRASAGRGDCSIS